jgi:hypothetical protein
MKRLLLIGCLLGCGGTGPSPADLANYALAQKACNDTSPTRTSDDACLAIVRGTFRATWLEGGAQ